MFAAAGTGALLCLLEGGEALVVLSGRRSRAWGEAVAAAGGALCCLGVFVGAVAVLPGRVVRVMAAAVVLVIGLQWLVRAVLRLLRPLPGCERSVFAVVLAAGVEAVLGCVVLAVVAGARPASWGACGWAFVVLGAGVGLLAPRALPALPERFPKVVLALVLIVTGAVAVAPADWWVSVAAVAAVTLGVLRLRSAPRFERARALSGVWGFLLGDTALTWPAAAAFTGLAAAVPSPGRPLLLSVFVAAVLMAVTGRRREPGRS